MFFFWDNFGWGELGCHGGECFVARPAPRIDGLADEGLELLNFNVEAQCTPSRYSPDDRAARDPLGHRIGGVYGRPGRYDPLGGHDRPGAVDAGYATGMWGKWHMGSVAMPERRSPVDYGLTRRCGPRATANSVLWTMLIVLPEPGGHRQALCGEARKSRWSTETVYSRKKGASAEPLGPYNAEFRAGFDRKITEWACDY